MHFDSFAVRRCAAIPRHGPNGPSDQVKRAIRASGRLGLTAHATFSGALAWPYV
jgi:hypothetical protein